MEELLLEPIAKSKRGIIGDALMDVINKSKQRFFVHFTLSWRVGKL